jgi:hypothetical protein
MPPGGWWHPHESLIQEHRERPKDLKRGILLVAFIGVLAVGSLAEVPSGAKEATIEGVTFRYQKHQLDGLPAIEAENR